MKAANSATALAIAAAERVPLSDPLLRAGIHALVSRRARRLCADDGETEVSFVREMRELPITMYAQVANAQHYELPPEFFRAVLGPRLKYSCCFYDEAGNLAEAEEAALEVTAEHAGLADGQHILELGCGWGSASLWMAQRYPRARILAVSNSHSQKTYIDAQANAQGLANLRVITADVADFHPAERFDRVVSVEMWEHVANWPALQRRVRGWLAPEGRLFLHVFSHRSKPYRFDHANPADWIAKHFFTGGMMPSHGLIAALEREQDAPFEIEEQWRWSGEHYRRTALDWLGRFDSNSAMIEPLIARTYGRESRLWRRRWRWFFMATAGLFGHQGGQAWGVSHFRLRPIR